MPGFIKKSETHASALVRVREWTRERFGLAVEAPVVVAEIACPLPGCPPIETVVVFWSEGRRHRFKVFKPVADVVRDDLPFGWLKPALAAADDSESGCC